ncbi:hypothetical protein FPANT_7530 [Fusarium pseudoanthophilum]|uniref:Uncharacterized protein n=1 Tax=Fusarium pseudoanthophilum TaxID=48495 RepID=A0A8H5L622_9HYPO|nr:hypothetical protein FPANT_7530 [Fusarium pseudoanthophilum]
MTCEKLFPGSMRVDLSDHGNVFVPIDKIVRNYSQSSATTILSSFMSSLISSPPSLRSAPRRSAPPGLGSHSRHGSTSASRSTPHSLFRLSPSNTPTSSGYKPPVVLDRRGDDICVRIMAGNPMIFEPACACRQICTLQRATITSHFTQSESNTNFTSTWETSLHEHEPHPIRHPTPDLEQLRDQARRRDKGLHRMDKQHTRMHNDTKPNNVMLATSNSECQCQGPEDDGAAWDRPAQPQVPYYVYIPGCEEAPQHVLGQSRGKYQAHGDEHVLGLTFCHDQTKCYIEPCASSKTINEIKNDTPDKSVDHTTRAFFIHIHTYIRCSTCQSGPFRLLTAPVVDIIEELLKRCPVHDGVPEGIHVVVDVIDGALVQTAGVSLDIIAGHNASPQGYGGQDGEDGNVRVIAHDPMATQIVAHLLRGFIPKVSYADTQDQDLSRDVNCRSRLSS